MVVPVAAPSPPLWDPNLDAYQLSGNFNGCCVLLSQLSFAIFLPVSIMQIQWENWQELQTVIVWHPHDGLIELPVPIALFMPGLPAECFMLLLFSLNSYTTGLGNASFHNNNSRQLWLAAKGYPCSMSLFCHLLILHNFCNSKLLEAKVRSESRIIRPE